MKYTTVRIPDDLRVRLAESAARNRRSLQAELWVILEDKFGLRSGADHTHVLQDEAASPDPLPPSISSGAFDTNIPADYPDVPKMDLRNVWDYDDEEFERQLWGRNPAFVQTAKTKRAQGRPNVTPEQRKAIQNLPPGQT